MSYSTRAPSNSGQSYQQQTQYGQSSQGGGYNTQYGGSQQSQYGGNQQSQYGGSQQSQYGGGQNGGAGPSAWDTRTQMNQSKVAKTENHQSWWDWMTGKPVQKAPAEIRDEKYAGLIISMDQVFQDWESNKMNKKEALNMCEYYMQKIKDIGRVDGEHARVLLEKQGINDQRRMDLEREYQDLKRQCGQKPPTYGEKQSKSSSSGFGSMFTCCSSPHEDTHAHPY